MPEILNMENKFLAKNRYQITSMLEGVIQEVPKKLKNLTYLLQAKQEQLMIILMVYRINPI